MNDATKQLFDLYTKMRSGTDPLTPEDLENAIRELELARDAIKLETNKRLQKEEFERAKKNNLGYGKVLYLTKNQGIHIDPHAYLNNTEITKVIIGNGVKTIGERAFFGCTGLKEVIFPQSKIFLQRECFKNCTALKRISIPNTTNIKTGVFENCTALEEAILPRNVSNIYSRAFMNCKSLRKFSIEDNEESLQKNCSTFIFKSVFEGCSSLEEIHLDTAFVHFNAFADCEKLKYIFFRNLKNPPKEFNRCSAKIINL